MRKIKIKESKIFTMVLAVAFAVVFICMAACTANEVDVLTSGDTSATAPSDEVTTAPLTEAKNEATFKSEYKPYKAVDADGSEVALSQVYGSSYTTYGGSLTFEGKKFDLNVGASNGKTAGTYEMGEDSKLTLNYDSGKIVSGEIVSVAEGVVEEIMLEQSDYYVYFK